MTACGVADCANGGKSSDDGCKMMGAGCKIAGDGAKFTDAGCKSVGTGGKMVDAGWRVLVCEWLKVSG